MSSPYALIVEDDIWLGEYYTTVLRQADIRSKHVTNALDAIAEIDDETPQVIIADMLLTGATAIALFHELQTYSDTKRIPIILITNIPNMTLERLRPYGVSRMLDKSTMKPTDITAAIRSVL